MATPPRRAKRIDEMERLSSVDTTNGTDLLLITRRLEASPEDWENYAIPTDDFITQVLSSVVIPPPAPEPVERDNVDDHALDYFDDYSVGAISSLDQGLGWDDDGVVTGGTIVTRTHQDGRSFKALSLLNGQVGRKMPWGDKWNKLRIMVGWRINASATFQTVDTEFFGVCSGTTNMVGSATTDNAIGLRWGSAAGENITFTAGTRTSYFNLGTAFRFISRRGTTNTSIASGGSGHSIPSTEGYFGFLLFRVHRPVFANDSSAVTYILLEGSTQILGAEFSRTKNALRQMLQDDSGDSSISTQDQNSGGMLGGSTTVSFDQSTGVLDTINITWPETVNPLELCCIGIRKLA